VASAELETAPQQIFESNVASTADCTPRIWDLSAPPAGDVPYTAGRFRPAPISHSSESCGAASGRSTRHSAAACPAAGARFLRVLLHGLTLASEPSAPVWHRHRREHEALHAEMLSYDAGLSGRACRQLLAPDTRSEVARRLPRGTLRVGKVTLRGDTRRAVLGVQLLGYVFGPVLYVRTRRAVVQRERAGARR